MLTGISSAAQHSHCPLSCEVSHHTYIASEKSRRQRAVEFSKFKGIFPSPVTVLSPSRLRPCQTSGWQLHRRKVKSVFFLCSLFSCYAPSCYVRGLYLHDALLQLRVQEKHYRSWLQGVKSDKVQLEVQLIEESWDMLQSNYSCHQTVQQDKQTEGQSEVGFIYLFIYFFLRWLFCSHS